MLTKYEIEEEEIKKVEIKSKPTTLTIDYGSPTTVTIDYDMYSANIFNPTVAYARGVDGTLVARQIELSGQRNTITGRFEPPTVAYARDVDGSLVTDYRYIPEITDILEPF